jgi:hypothetical protein
MGTSELFDKYFQQVAKQAVQNKTTPTPSSTGAPSFSLLKSNNITPTTGGVEGAWSLGQGLIDFLSTGSYATAGLGRGIGEAAQQAGRGDLFGGIGSILSGPGKGITERRSWSKNLQDLGVSEADSAGWGLALDIAVDPLWLVPGGAFAAGIKGTSRGLMAGAAANKAGTQLSKEAFEAATKKLAESPIPRTDKENIQRFSPLRDENVRNQIYADGAGKISSLTPTGFKNLYQGIRQGNVENYSEWAALRKVQKASKAARKFEKTGDTRLIDKFENKYNIDPFTLVPQMAKVVDEVVADVGRAADEPTLERGIENTPAEVAEVTEKAVKAQKDVKATTAIEKDANAVSEAVEATTEAAGATTKGINSTARETLGPAKTEYLASRNLPAPSVDAATLAGVKTSKIANDIADDYDKLINDPTNPQVIAAYKKFSEEVDDQFKYLTEEKGIKVEFVDADPYVKIVDGKATPDSAAMMKDVVENGRLKVYKTADDQAHPILSKDINDKFRAIHDFFGHATSGRGFHGDGEEAAWISHSMMFSPLARRAMTTETRGQNSWVNKYATEEKPFADQKAGLLPEAYSMLPSEYALLENQVAATNSLIGRIAAILTSKNDILIDDLGLVYQQTRGLMYTKEDFASIKKTLDEITGVELVKPGSAEHKLVMKTIDSITNRIVGEQRIGNIGEDLVDLITKLDDASANALHKVLNTPTDASDLLTKAAAFEGRALAAPKPFKATTWNAPGNKYSKPPFSLQKLEQYFPEDPMLSNAKDLEIAMGSNKATTRALSGETKEQALARKQARLWEDFRTRNADRLSNVKDAERAEWKNTNEVPGSDLFVEGASGVIGVGKMPLGLPRTMFNSHSGRVTTSLAQVIENIGAMIIREPLRAVRGTGGFETTISAALKKKTNVTKPGTQEVEVSELMFPEDEILDFVASSKVSGAKFDVVGADGLPIEDWLAAARRGEGLPAGAKLVASVGADGLPNAKAMGLLTRLKEIKPEINIDRMQPVVKDWIEGKLAALKGAVSTKNIRVARASNVIDENAVAITARKLMDANPAVKSFDDAQLIIAGFDDALAALSGKRQRKYFVKRDEVLPDRGTKKPKNDGELEPLSYDYGLVGGRLSNEDATLLTTSGKQYTGRQAGRDKLNRPYEPQFTPKGTEQLAGVKNVMGALDNIVSAITAKELVASPEQAQLLGRVLGELGIKVAGDATPKQIFEQFASKAPTTYKELVQGIEAAAKREAVMYQAQRAFTMSVDENMALLEAIEKTDPGEVQRRVMQFTDDVTARLDDMCRLRFGDAAPSPTQFLDRVIRGEN